MRGFVIMGNHGDDRTSLWPSTVMASPSKASKMVPGGSGSGRASMPEAMAMAEAVRPCPRPWPWRWLAAGCMEGRPGGRAAGWASVKKAQGFIHCADTGHLRQGIDNSACVA